MADEREPVRLSSFKVEGLFGEFNHYIPLSDASRITALIGPNGMGKTACLRLINALFRRQWSVFSTTEFDRVEYLFSDATLVRVHHGAAEASADEPGVTPGVVIETRRHGICSDTWCPRLREARSEERRVGTECGSTCRSRWSTLTLKIKENIITAQK